MNDNPPCPTLSPLLRAEIQLGNVNEIGITPLGRRRVISITGGSFTGERVSGEVLPQGADWQLIRPDGVAIFDARYTWRTVDGAVIYVNNQGVRSGPPDVLAQLSRGEAVDPARYYLRTTTRFETGAAQYAWLNDLIAVASAIRRREFVVLDYYAVS